ncbi:phage tail tape measure protein [Afifella pfennigii]|uniref:phage tail tape measure protein n=1 Tax=Afifella pfennigii TaxID=209897 RepID=UPI000A0261C6|nr:phage tail tape measure protein [Afifella pfennigii]
MSSRSMALDVLVRLRDRLSGPLRRLRNNLRSLGNAARQIGFVGTAIAAISFLGPIQEAAAFQQKLLDIAGTANLTGEAAFDFARQTQGQYEELAVKIGQSSDTIADGAGQMVAAGGRAAEIVDKVIGTVGKSATAANAEFSDMAGVATALVNTLDVPEAGLEGALAGLVVAGKEGAFELKDMARYFPQLTGQMKKFGIVGREASDQIASLLQIARKGTSDPGQAANNLQNFLSKALAPVTQKKFADMGVDIEAVMKDAAAKGINPLEAMIQKIGVLTGVSADSIGKYMETAKKRGLEGGEALDFVRQQLEAIGAAGKLGELFQDQQVLDFLIPMLANIEEYKRIKAEVAAATGGIIDEDFKTQMQGINRQLVILREIGTQAVRRVGMAFGTWLPDVNSGLMMVLSLVNRLNDATGGWVDQALVAAGGGILLTGALGALGLALPVVAAGFSALASLAAVALGPIGLLLGALAAGAIYISKNWDRYGPRIMRMWDRTKRRFQDFAHDVVNRYGPAVRDGVGRAWEWASSRAGVAIDRLKAVGAGAMDRARIAVETVGRFAQGFGRNVDLSGFRKAAEELATTFRTLGGIFDDLDALLGKTGIDWKKLFGEGTEGIGSVLGKEFSRFGEDLAGVVASLNDFLGVVRSIISILSGDEPIPWSKMIPASVVEAFEKVAQVIERVKSAIISLKEAVSGFSFSGAMKSLNESLGGNNLPSPPANENNPSGRMPGGVEGRRLRRKLRQRSSLEGRSQAAAVMPARADVSGTIRIAVEGPGKVAGASSSNPGVRLAPDRGRAVGRA